MPPLPIPGRAPVQKSLFQAGIRGGRLSSPSTQLRLTPGGANRHRRTEGWKEAARRSRRQVAPGSRAAIREYFLDPPEAGSGGGVAILGRRRLRRGAALFKKDVIAAPG